VQFDRCDTEKMYRFFTQHADLFSDMQAAIDEFFEQDRAYRRSLPDITRHGSSLVGDPALRKAVRAGLIEGYLAADLVDDAFAQKLQHGGLRFTVFYLLGAFPIIGKLIRKRWGNRAYREHVFSCLTNLSLSEGRAARPRRQRADRLAPRRARGRKTCRVSDPKSGPVPA
jgi:hypothetical protein